MRALNPNACVVLLGTAITFAATIALAMQDQPAPPQANAPARQPLPGEAELKRGDEAFARQDWPAAAQAYTSALEAGLDPGPMRMRLGFAIHMQGRYAEALPHHLAAAGVPFRPIRIDGLYNAACAYARLGNKEMSLQFLTKAIDAGFVDAAQVNNDSDLDSLRDDPQFKSIVAGIGTTPVLSDWMDFMVGEWTQPMPDGQIAERLRVSRPLDGSSALLTTCTNIGGGQLTGLMWPDSDSRTWKWTVADGMGSTRTSTGTPIDGGGMQFTGVDAGPAGACYQVRETLTPQLDGTVRARVEVSTDAGTTWRTHHDAPFTRVTEPANDGG